MTATIKKTCVGTLGLLLAPFAFFSLWLLPTECGIRFGLEGVCYLFLFMSDVIGLCFLWYLPIPLVAKICATPFYAFAMGCALFTFWLVVGEAVFDRWLCQLPPNHALQPTRVGVGSSAFAGYVTGPAWLSLGR
jgi:hypothetical protein